MRILVVNTDYADFLSWFYERHPGLATAPYDEQMRARNESLFGFADSYSRNLRALGHEAWDIYANNDLMQSAWAKEHGMNATAHELIARAKQWAKASPLRHLKPWLRPFVPARNTFDVLAEQVRHYRPDILLNQSMDGIPDSVFLELKPSVRLIAGQIAAPLVEKQVRSYDLVISSLPNFVEYFRQQGIPSELHRLGFDPRILSRLEKRPKRAPVSFVGSVTGHHSTRTRLVETICEHADLSWWGQGIDTLPADSILRRHHRGVAWGLDMFQALCDSKITVNHHINIAGNFANNMRLFEATGVGTMLLTDRKQNLHEMFEPGKEVVEYTSAEECVEAIRHYLDHDSEREAIALAGQQRTLRDHNYAVRMQELADIFTGCLCSAG